MKNFRNKKRLSIFSLLVILLIPLNSALATPGGQSFTIPVTALATTSSLTNLTGSAITLSPAFDPTTLNYTATVANGVAATTVTATFTGTGETVTINGTAKASGAASGSISLAEGLNTISVVATAEDGSTTTYTILVTRACTTQVALGSFDPTATANSIARGNISVTSLGAYYITFCSSTTPVNVNASMSTLTSGSDTIANSNVTYSVGSSPAPAWAASLGAVTTSNSGVLTTSRAVLVLTPVLTSTRLDWTPGLSIAVPADAAAGTYTSTVTTSVS